MRRSALPFILLLLLPACNLASAPPTSTPPPSATPVPLELIATFTPPAAGQGEITGILLNPDCQSTPSTWIAYAIEAGDTLSLLAEQTDSTVDELMTGNCLDNADQLILDTVMFLPRVPLLAPVGSDEPEAVG